MTLARLGGGGRFIERQDFHRSPATLSVAIFLSSSLVRPFSPCSPGLPPPPSPCRYHHRRRNRRHFPHRGPFTQLSPSSDEFGRPTAQPPQPRDHPSESLDGFLAIISSYRPSSRSAVDERTDRHTANTASFSYRMAGTISLQTMKLADRGRRATRLIRGKILSGFFPRAGGNAQRGYGRIFLQVETMRLRFRKFDREQFFSDPCSQTGPII